MQEHEKAELQEKEETLKVKAADLEEHLKTHLEQSAAIAAQEQQHHQKQLRELQDELHGLTLQLEERNKEVC